ncbi:MAG: helix-turn-helix transcriptional regulator [Cyanobacteria bacterium P01_A01_bin.80]
MKVICKLKALMDSKDITQLELAEKTGLAPSTVGRLYRNQVSRIDTATLLAIGIFFELKSISEIIEFEH